MVPQIFPPLLHFTVIRRSMLCPFRAKSAIRKRTSTQIRGIG